MRVAPVGLFAWRLSAEFSPEDTFRLGAELAALTHGHPTGALTAGAFAVLLLALTDGATLRDALTTAKEILRQQSHHEETLRATGASGSPGGIGFTARCCDRPAR